jgi:methionine synthase II (cobalamin-independent)
MMPKEIKIKVPTPNEVLPEEFKTHVINAYKEFLLAMRSLIDEQIKKLEELESKEKKEIKKIDIS